jgi:hypothetical protein
MKAALESVLAHAKGQSLTFQADLLAAEVKQSGVVSRVSRGHVQLQQHLDFRTFLTRAEKANAETQENQGCNY